MNDSARKNSLSRVNKITIILLVLFLVLMMLTNDDGSFELCKWLLVIFIISYAMKPFLMLKTIKLPDGGFSVSFGLGTAIAFLTSWYFAAFKLVPFNTPVCILGIVIPALLIRIIKTYLGKSSSFSDINASMKISAEREDNDRFFLGFAAFLLIFFAIFYIKGFRPEIDFQTEQYMDYGFMMSMYRQQLVAPYDIWYAGSRLNYYYLGQACATYLCRVSFVTPAVGYNFMLCTVFSSLVMMSYSLCYGILSVINTIRKRGRILGGVIGAMAVSFAGNGHFLIYGFFVPIIEKITGRVIVEGDYWFPDSTVYIGTNPDLPDKGKHEFPAYTILLGDLHAHVCNMLFTLPLLVILFDYAASKYISAAENNTENNTENTKSMLIPYLKEIFTWYVIVLGVLTGLYRGVNYWDFPIYFIVSGAIILFSDLYCAKKGFKSKLITVAIVLIKGAVILAIGTLVMLPFNMYFVKMASAIKLCKNHSQLYKLAILWAIPIVLSLWLIAYLIIKVRSEKRKISCTELACILTALCAIGLVFLPEVIYVEDIYGESYARFNTMFKLTFQAFILFGILIGVLAGLLFGDTSYEQKSRVKLFKTLNLSGAILVSVLVVMLSGFFAVSVKSWFGNIFDYSSRKCISSLDSVLATDADFGAIGVINSDPEKLVNILETAGLSYTKADRISVFTGACTVRGWHTHEWLWRDDPESVNNRGDEIRRFYESGDDFFCLNFIRQYNIKYIYVGEEELNNYFVNYSGFLALADVVWNNAAGNHYLFRVKDNI